MKRIITNVVTAVGCILFVITIGQAAQHIISSGGEPTKTVCVNKGLIAANSPGIDMVMVKKVMGDLGQEKNGAKSGITDKAHRHGSKHTASRKAVAHNDKRNDIKYWNTYVANVELVEQEIFYNELLNEVQKYPVAMGN